METEIAQNITPQALRTVFSVFFYLFWAMVLLCCLTEGLANAWSEKTIKAFKPECAKYITRLTISFSSVGALLLLATRSA